MRLVLIVGLAACCTSAMVFSAENSPSLPPVTAANVTDPGPNSADEPLAASFSSAAAEHFLDSAALNWQAKHNCMTCHTNYLYLIARPALGVQSEAYRTVRQFAEDLVSERWPDKGPRWDAEVVMTALVLATSDAATSAELHPLTRTALDRIWTVQREDGGFDWLKCDWPPMESDDEFGAPMAALAVSIAPADYAQTPAAVAGIAKLQTYFSAGHQPTLHHRAMLAWADTHRPGWLAAAEREQIVKDILALQHPDGGWSLPSLGDWKRADGTPQHPETSDGYATGLAIYLARRAGVPASDPALQKGVAWLKANQRASGRWFTRSLHQDSKHYITHAGTSMAVLALGACDALDRP